MAGAPPSMGSTCGWARRVMDIVKNEPVLMQSLVQVILGLLLAFGVSLSVAQTGSIMAFVAVVLAIITRFFVTPVAKLPSA